MKVIGLSFENCVAELADGKHSYDDVVKVWANTRAADAAAWVRVIAYYADGSCWANRKEHPIVMHPIRKDEVLMPAVVGDDTRLGRCVDIANRLVADGKVTQPRLTDGMLAIHLVRGRKGSLDGPWFKAYLFRAAMKAGREEAERLQTMIDAEG